MKVKNILVPVDFSACSKNALRAAIAVAKKFQAKIHMVNAVHVNAPHPDFIGGNLLEAILTDYESQVKESFDELETEIIELKDVPHEADRFISYLTDAIYSECEQKDIDLVIMGTRAQHDKIEHMIGTRATDIIGTSKVPVIVIPEQITHFEPKIIGFASDLTQVRNVEKLSLVLMLAKAFGASVEVFSVVEDATQITAADHRIIKDISDFFKEVECSARTVESQSIVTAIKDFTKSHELDMLAMIPRQRSFFNKLFKSSVTKNVALDLDIPLLSFHE